MSFPPATEMFQFTGFASRAYGFSAGYPLRGGLPHSEIPGSTIARISPGLFAACRVLHRLSVPRHPPDALHSRSITRDAAPREMTRRSSARPAAPRKTAAHRGKPHPLAKRGATPPAAARMKTLLGRRPVLPAPIPQGNRPTEQQPAPAARPPRSHSQIRFTLQSTPAPEPRPPARDMPARPPGSGTKPGLLRTSAHRSKSSAHTEQNLARASPAVDLGASGGGRVEAPMVEVNGIEPMTSCLQSRRSPN